MQQNNFKIIIVGDSMVGKTSFITRFLSGYFDNEYIPTPGMIITHFMINSNNVATNYYFWDIAGAEKNNMSDSLFKGADGAIIMFNRNCKNSYMNIEFWYKKIYKICQNIPTLIINSKCEYSDSFQNDNPIFHPNYDLAYFNISSKNNINIGQPILWFIDKFNKPRLPSMQYIDDEDNNNCVSNITILLQKLNNILD